MLFSAVARPCGSPRRCQTGSARQKVFFRIDFQCRNASGTGHRMTGIGVAVEEFDGILRSVHQPVIDLAAGEYRAHRDRAIGQALGCGHEVRHDAEIVGRKRRAETAETGDDFIENQQDAVFLRDLANALQIALWRKDDTGRARHRLYDDGCNGFRAVQLDQTLQILRQFQTVRRQTL